MRFLGILSSVALTAALYAMLWGGVALPVATPDEGMWSVCAVSAALFGYLLIQSYAARTPSENIGAMWALDIGFSVLPLFTIGAALISHINFDLPFDTLQWIVILLSILAVMIDLILIGTLSAPRPRSSAPPTSVMPLRK